MSLRSARFALPGVLAFPPVIWAQAALEYALKSSPTAPATANGTIAGCPVDSNIALCLRRTYPRASLIVITLVALWALRWLASRFRYRAR